MNTQERWKHAAEVAAWMADGKKVQLQLSDGDWCDTPDPDVTQIVYNGWKYRVKPGPLECICTLGKHKKNDKILRDSGFHIGDRVRVTKMDDQSSTSPR